jgi:hypothetical protein
LSRILSSREYFASLEKTPQCRKALGRLTWVCIGRAEPPIAAEPDAPLHLQRGFCVPD